MSDQNTDSNNKKEKKIVTDENYPKLKFVSASKVHTIIVELDAGRHEALINTMSIQSYSPVDLALLLREIATELKKINIHHIVQQVNKSDWTKILRPMRMFEFVNENKVYGYINVKCKTEIFPTAVMKAMGFAEL